MSDKRTWELLAKQFNNEISEDELRELRLLLLERKDTGSFPDLLAEMHHLTFKPEADDRSRKDNSLSAIRRAIGGSKGPGTTETYEITEEQPGRRRHKSVSFGVMVFFAILPLAGYFGFRHFKRTGELSLPFETIVTRPGSKTLINLPDSSTVVLNSACKFGYNKAFGAGRREIQLSGEAYFDIHKSPEMPLIIQAGNVIIKVLGTSFNVRAYPEDSFVEATLIKGSIEVSLRSDPERKILLRPNEKIVIQKEEASLPGGNAHPSPKNKEEMIAVTKTEPDPVDSSYVETAWTQDRMLFHKEAFGSLARKMERWYNVKIILADPELNELIFTGSLEKETLPEALTALQHTAWFNYKIEGQTVTVTKNKEKNKTK